jgi:hypothetical protein
MAVARRTKPPNDEKAGTQSVPAFSDDNGANATPRPSGDGRLSTPFLREADARRLLIASHRDQQT